MKLNPSLTTVRTGLRAVDILAKIFIPTDMKKEEKALVKADQPVIKNEVEKIVTVDSSSEMKSELEESVTIIHSTIMNSEGIEAVASNQGIVKKEGVEESITSKSNDASMDPLNSQKTILRDIEHPYELQIASFRSKENAILAARSIQELGFETEILSGGNGNKDKWYRLIMRPFETIDEALDYKVKIENEYRFNPILRKTVAGDPEPKEILSPRQLSEKEKPVNLKNVDVEISNGNGVYRMGRKVGDYLKKRGLKVNRLTNADHFNHSGTKVLYRKECKEVADQIAEQIPVVRSKEQIENFDRPNIRIKILIGKDLIPHHKVFENRKSS
jgi:hypothetical protein